MGWTVTYYETPSGRQPIKEFLDGLSGKAFAKCNSYICLLQEHGSRLPASHNKHLRGKIWELRPEFGGNEYRFLYAALAGHRLVVLHAVQKKRQTTREHDIRLAETRLAEALRRKL